MRNTFCKVLPILASIGFLGLANLSYQLPVVAAGTDTVVQHVDAHPVEVKEEKIGDKVYQVSRILVNVKADRIWQILTDYDSAVGIFPCLKKCKVVKDHGSIKQVEHEIKPSGLPGTFEYLLEIKEVANRYQEWHRISGDFHEVEGFWKLEPVEDGAATMVTYASRVDGGFFIPQAIIKRQVRAEVPGVMAALKTHAETSRHIAGVADRIVKPN